MIETIGYTLHASSGSHLHRIEQAKRVITEWLSHCDKPYVAFSGGKDSSVMLHLVRQIAPEIEAVYCDDQYAFAETTSLLNITANLRKIANTTAHTEWFTAWDDERPGSDIEYLGDNHPLWAHRLGYDGACIGLRAEENSYRKIALKKYGMLHYVNSKQLWQCYPLAWWTLDDIWAYIHVNEVPYNKAYDVMDHNGIPKYRQRIGPLANWRAVSQGQAMVLKKCFPDAYRVFAKEHPEIARFL